MELASITKRWTRRHGFLWYYEQIIDVTAQQIAVPNDTLDIFATGKLTISVDGKVVLEEDLPWATPRGEIMLPLVVYMLARYPGYNHPEWRRTMMKFCSRCEGWTPPLALHWSRYSEIFD